MTTINYDESSSSIKAQKEAFVQGHAGSDHPWEVLWVCSVVVWSSWLYSELVHRQLVVRERSAFLLEALIIWCPMIIVQTEYLYPYGTGLMVCQILLAGGLAMSRRRGKETKESTTTTTATNELEYLTLYRSSIYYLTFVAILAVDFHVFPRRFCKTEVAGYGFMDMGAASFCISGGIVKGKAYAAATRGDGQNSERTTKNLWWTPLQRAAPLLVIGLVRCFTNKSVDYQEHVTEYGVHWNFFVTLGVLAVVPTIRRQLLLLPRLPSQLFPMAKTMRRIIQVVPLAGMLMYQHSLLDHGLQEFIEDAPRDTSFYAANREGILGCIGYVFLHTAGEWIGKYFVFGAHNNRLGPVVIALWILHFLPFGHHPTLTVSRRSTNLPFCLWALAHNVTLLWLLRMVSAKVVPPTWRAVNRHGMVAFLVANVLTGLTNLAIPTLEVTNPTALVVLFVYIALVGGAVRLVNEHSKYFSLPKKTTTPSSSSSESSQQQGGGDDKKTN